jgi:hypothetical protein
MTGATISKAVTDCKPRVRNDHEWPGGILND